ncbi:MAG: (2Fe-2S)-binding protein [Thermodesulfobacteriota bacterium]
MSSHQINLIVNGVAHEVLVPANRTLAQLLREDLGLTGTKQGCGEGDCGSCTVLLDGEPVNSCLVLALQAHGHKVLTIEGLSQGRELHPIQQAFVEQGAVQCGFCTPGMILSAKALLDKTKRPSQEQIRKALSGNLCRCTGYQKIVEAVSEASRRLSRERS